MGGILAVDIVIIICVLYLQCVLTRDIKFKMYSMAKQCSGHRIRAAVAAAAAGLIMNIRQTNNASGSKYVFLDRRQSLIRIMPTNLT